MLILESPILLRQQCRLYHQQNISIALVPTMGNLHAGHSKLLEVARQQAEVVIVGLFANPMQFAREANLAAYPHNLQQDYEMLSRYHADVVFAPQESVFCPQGLAQHTFVEVPVLSSMLEGVSRPGYFRGIATAFSKLLNLIQPDSACFGEKDYQQLHIVRQLTADMGYDTDIVAVPTVRNAQGLALSSRNRLLSDQQLNTAANLYQTLQQLATRVLDLLAERGATQAMAELETLIQPACQHLQDLGFHQVDLQICDADNLLPLNVNSTRAVLLLSAWLGDVRLTDNLIQPLVQPLPAFLSQPLSQPMPQSIPQSLPQPLPPLADNGQTAC